MAWKAKPSANGCSVCALLVWIRRPITYRRALFRWIGSIGLGGASLGLAFLWILWQREKRGWHDFLARTWVIRRVNLRTDNEHG